MFIKNIVKILVFSVVFAFFCGCEAVDTIMPSSSAYKVNARINGQSIDGCSFISLNEKIYPYFDAPVSNDPDVTALVVFLKNSNGGIVGGKVKYCVSGEAESGETLIFVKSLDGDLPPFSLPTGLRIGHYTYVSQILSGKDVLQRNERAFFYMGDTAFSYEGINVYLPGITSNAQIIPKETVLMLEAKLNFDGRMDPYILWYDGKNKISEGKFSDGAGILFWKAPEQSGFFSISAEVFPMESYAGLAGYKKEISLLVSSNTTDMNLVSEDVPQLTRWYVLDGNLYDSKKTTIPADRSLKPAADNNPRWIMSDGVYGLAAGYDNGYTLPKVFVSSDRRETWQALFRFLPINDGQIFAALFERYPDISVSLSKTGQNLVLKLSSPQKTVSQTVRIPEGASHGGASLGGASFITSGISFSILPDQISAKINVMGDSIEQGELAAEPISLETGTIDNFVILLGAAKGGAESAPVTALWDEFALYNSAPAEIISAEIKRAAREDSAGMDTSSQI